MIKVYDVREFLDEDCEKAFQTFPKVLKEKVLKKSDDTAKKMCIAEYLCLRKLLKIENLDNLSFSKNGKPCIENDKYFNISNSGNLFCIAVSKVPVGVDIQKIFYYKENLAKKICNEREFEELKKAKNKDLAMTKLWTKKESFIKCKGETIGQNLKSLLENCEGFKFKFLEVDGFVICGCEKTL